MPCCGPSAAAPAPSCKKSEPPAWMARASVDSLPEGSIRRGDLVLLRADLNVPLSSTRDGGSAVSVLDAARVEAAVPTIRFLTSRGARVLLLTHVGRPKGKVVEGLTTDALVPVLEAALQRRNDSDGDSDERAASPLPPPPPVTKIDECVGPLVAEAASRCPEGGIVLLENVRFHAGEERNDPEFARSLADAGGGGGTASPSPSSISLYVNDAFGAAHRAHASTAGVADVLRSRGVPCVAGLLLREELARLGRVLCCPRRPLVALVGGGPKASDKIPTLERLAGHADDVEVLGGLAATFLVADGGSVGGSKIEPGAVAGAKSLLERSRKEKKQREGEESENVADGEQKKCCGPKRACCPSRSALPDGEPSSTSAAAVAAIHLPVDAVAAKSLSPTDAAAAVVVPARAVPAGLSAFDAGPQTVEAVRSLVKKAGTVVWNGPLGVFEVPPFGKGTEAIARALAELHDETGAETIVGGGHSVAAVNAAGLASKFSHVSTGGGASLELLEGRVLPGVVALDFGAGLAGVCD